MLANIYVAAYGFRKYGLGILICRNVMPASIIELKINCEIHYKQFVNRNDLFYSFTK